ncbi:DNA replication/repair protein RecF [Sphaerochaeta sp. PS]|uniref:DNA replication/repair protein RecF n=1 Tax=Sphaerochaeta sp. PS TaxID=3076336 RepID=UPI0028A37B2D|nr:DNA replication and repair protein RecF [Sphaerochaeta sp. PS]MDT4762454.1 DNA replication and repair protein RecF [Sphaerochaeta sp. PS]
MVFTEIQAVQFRNLCPEAVPVNKRQVFLIGSNGQGKTNFLEAIYTLCYGSSFRSAQMRELAQHGQKAFRLSGKYLGEDGLLHSLVLEFQDTKRKVLLDGREIKDRKELIYNIPCIVFSHDDIAFVRGEPEQRRRFFDQTMSMYDPLFFDDMRRYRGLLKQRNLAIKEGRQSLLGLYDIQLAKYGLAIQGEREKAVAEFDQIFPEMYRKVSNSDLNIHLEYQGSWGSFSTEDEIVDYLEGTRQRDLNMQTTTSGIHRDRFNITVDEGLFSQIGSTGQLRLASLILRTAQMDFFHKKSGKQPLILVDDVLLELDLPKREMFLSLMQGYSQAFFTFLPQEHYFASLAGEDALLYDVREGRFCRHEG